MRPVRITLGSLAAALLVAALLTAPQAQAVGSQRAGATTSASAAALPPFTCGSTSGGSTATLGHLRAVRVGHHTGYDRFVIEFTGTVLPHYALTPKSSAVFYLDPSGRPVVLRGTAGILVVLSHSTGAGTFTGATDLVTAFPQLREARRLGDFEAVTSWGIGLAHQSCKRVFALAGPTRLVIDVPA